MNCKTIKSFLNNYEKLKRTLNYMEFKKGNYSMIVDEEYICHYYYDNLICLVNLDEKIFSLHHCGYNPSCYTTTQLNFLEKYYRSKGCELKYRDFN